MGVLGNIYCIPSVPCSVSWESALPRLVKEGVVRGPFRAGSPFMDLGEGNVLVHPENEFSSVAFSDFINGLPHRDYQVLEEGLAYIRNEPAKFISMDSPCSAFQNYPDSRAFSAALALYRFRDPVPLQVGVPEDYSDLIDEFPHLANAPTKPKWQGEVTELVWLHGGSVMPEEEFHGTPLHALLLDLWPAHTLLSDFT